MKRNARYWAQACIAADLVVSVERDKGPGAVAELPAPTLELAFDYLRRLAERRKRQNGGAR